MFCARNEFVQNMAMNAMVIARQNVENRRTKKSQTKKENKRSIIINIKFNGFCLCANARMENGAWLQLHIHTLTLSLCRPSTPTQNSIVSIGHQTIHGRCAHNKFYNSHIFITRKLFEKRPKMLLFHNRIGIKMRQDFFSLIRPSTYNGEFIKVRLMSVSKLLFAATHTHTHTHIIAALALALTHMQCHSQSLTRSLIQTHIRALNQLMWRVT